MTEIQDAIKLLAQKAGEMASTPGEAGEAMKLSQAALNLAHTDAMLQQSALLASEQ